MSNIQNTKNKLTLTFTIIVFIVILTFGLVFFSTKYIQIYTAEKRNFLKIAQLVDNDNLKLDALLKFQREIHRENGKTKHQKPWLEKELLGRGGINFILFNNENEIISHNVKVEIGESFWEDIVDIKKYSQVKLEDNFLLTKIPFKKIYSLVLFQKVKYGIADYLTDMLYFLILSTFLSGLIYIIGRSFVNKAFIPVEENIQDMKNFVHNAGHELKTPLAVIDSNLQLADDINEYNKEINLENKTELKKLNSLIDSLIQLSDIDGLKAKERINLKNIIEEILEDYRAKIMEKNIDYSISIDKNISINSHKDYLYIFIANLIGNAIKYNRQDGKIDISYSKGELFIKDTGVGISDSDKDKIWNRFFQADSSRGGEGFGIGLSLVKKISQIYKWRVKVSDNKKEGSIFNIKF